MAESGNAAKAGASRRRIHILAAVLVAWLAVIALRLVYLQIFSYGDLEQRAQRQQQRSIEVAARRGVIYDRNGRELAMSVAVDSIFAVPSEVPDHATTARLLARILKADPADLMARMKSSRAFCWIARKVDPEVSERIRDLNLKGIYFQKESRRSYPKNELAAQVLGYVGMDDEGLGGLERAYDGRLRGKEGKMLISMDARRRWFGRVERQPEPGENLVLTLDEKIQYITERELDVAMKQTRAVAGTIIVADPHTGEVLALANRPSFNPNQLHSTEALKNRAVSDIYEPGSTFKIVTIPAALEEKLTRPDEVVDCQMGSITIANTRIRDHKPFGDLTVAQVLSNSSDVGAIKIGLRLGDDRLYQYIRAFGFGAQTGIELPGETRGISRPASRWSKSSIGAISMGQEIGVSPMQLVGMVSTIANDGLYTPPRIVAGTSEPVVSGGPGLDRIVFRPAQQRQVVSQLTALEMKRMLEGVVLFGTGRKALLEGYTSAGKTGTAQKADPSTGRYSRTNYVASFGGFAPVANPAITVVVILDSPQGLHEGGQVAAPVFARIAQQTLAYMNVPHDAEITGARRQLLLAARRASDADISEASPDRVGESLMAESRDGEPSAPQPTAASLADSAGRLAPASLKLPIPVPPPARQKKTQPPGPPPTPHDAAGAVPAAHAGTVIMDVGAGVLVPDFSGRPLREALVVAQDAGLELEVIGSGVARDQSPPAGSRVPAGGHVAVRFAR